MCSVLRSVRTAGRRDLLAGLKSVVGGELKSYTEMLEDSKKAVKERLIRDCHQAFHFCNLFSGDGFGRCHDHAFFPFRVSYRYR
jgi:hypothetical protein